MYPELLRLGPLVISSYGILLAIAFISGIAITNSLAKKRDISPEHVVNLALIIIISSIVGSRLLYVLFHLEEFRGRWIYTFVPLQRDGTIGLSGLVLLGGVLLSIITSVIYLKRKQLSLWGVADSISPALAFGLFLGRIGCFLNGCCFGKVCDKPWGVKFPEHSYAAILMNHQPLHPTQLYSSFYALFIFSILMLRERKSKREGLLSGTFLILYGLGRFTVDFYRYYETQMFILGHLTVNQLISLAMVAGGIVILITKVRKATPIFSN